MQRSDVALGVRSSMNPDGVFLDISRLVGSDETDFRLGRWPKILDQL